MPWNALVFLGTDGRKDGNNPLTNIDGKKILLVVLQGMDRKTFFLAEDL